jgi:ATP-dependent Lon protease
MHTVKETVCRLLEDLPDNASLEDIQYHIYVREKIERGQRDVYVREKIERGQRDVEAGRMVDQDEAKRDPLPPVVRLALLWNGYRGSVHLGQLACEKG